MTPSPAVSGILERLRGVQGSGPQWTACCPAHEDKHPSLSIGIGIDGRILLKCHAGCEPDAIVAHIGLTLRDLAPPTNADSGAADRRIVTTYTYRNEAGALLFEVVRYSPKDFRQRRPDGKGGWAWNLDGVRRVLYRLPDLRGKPAVFLVEGEKDAERLWSLGFRATTNAGGAGKWREEYTNQLWAAKVKRVAILPDNDEPGERHARDVARSCLKGGLQVKVLRLEGLQVHEDVSDWFDAGHSVEELRTLAKATAFLRLEDIEADSPAHQLPAIEPFAPFPVSALPEPVRRFVVVAAKAIGCDPSYIALPLLAAFASAIGTSRRIRLKRGWAEPSVLWIVIVGESGTLKSPALDIALRAVHQRQGEALREYERDLASYEKEVIQYEKDLANWKKNKAGGPPPEKPERPVAMRLVVSDATVEALATILSDNPRGLLLGRDELSGFLGSFDRYAQRGKGDCAHWLEMHRAGALVVDRKTGEKKTIYVPRAAVSIAGGIQPGSLRAALTPEFFENGLAARLLLAMPPPRPRKWTDAEIPEELEDAIGVVFDRLLTLELHKGEDGEERPVDLPLTPEAKRLWIEFFESHAEEASGLEGELAAAWSKLEGYAARFALVLHLVRWASGKPEDGDAVDVDSMQAGIVLARWFGVEARRVYAALAESDEERARRQLVEAIGRWGGQTTSRDLAHGLRRFRGQAAAADKALDDLVRRKLGTWTEEKPQRGPATRVFRLTEGVTVTEFPPVSEGKPGKPGDGDGGTSQREDGGEGIKQPPEPSADEGEVLG